MKWKRCTDPQRDRTKYMFNQIKGVFSIARCKGMQCMGITLRTALISPAHGTILTCFNFANADSVQAKR